MTLHEPRRIHLDTDIGGDMDDLCALALLLRWPGVEITGITTVTEENGRRAGYVRYVLELEGRGHIPIAAGADLEVRDGWLHEIPDPDGKPFDVVTTINQSRFNQFWYEIVSGQNKLL